MDNNSRDLVINSTAPPFDRPEVRRAVALSLDRQAFLDILVEREGAVGGAMLPPPDGVWGMTQDVLRKLPGYGSDVARNREEARALMRKAGYGPDRRLAIKLSTRNIPAYRDAAVIAVSHLREIYIDAELDLIERPIISRASRARITSSPSMSPPAVSTTRIRNSTRIMPAAPSATIPAIATRRPTG